MKQNNIITYILLVLTAIFWGGSFVLTKEIFLAAPTITPSIIVTLRLIVASVVFVPFLLITRRWQKIQRKDIKYFFILAVVLAQEVGKWFEKGKDKEIFDIFALDLLPSVSDK